MAKHAALSVLVVLSTAAGTDSISMVQQTATKGAQPLDTGVAAFRTGELVEALDEKTGTWMPSHILGMGSRPETFSLAVPDIGVVQDVTAVALRRATRMRSGDLVEVHDMTSGEWYPGTIIGNGEKEMTYDVNVPISGGNLKEVPAVAVRRAARLRAGETVEVMDADTGLWVPGTIEGDGSKPGTYNLDAHAAGRFQDVTAVIVRRAEAPKEGDQVQLLNNKTGNWVQATVVSNGTKQDTFLLVVQDIGFVYDVPSVAIRKVAKHSESAIGRQLLADERAEYMDKITGTWVPVKVESNGTKTDSYTIVAPVLGKMFDVSVAALRKPYKFNEGDHAEVLDMKTGVWLPGTIVGEGRVENTMDMTIPQLGFYPDVPLDRLRQAVMPQTGEVLEVIDSHNMRWLTCRVVSKGSKAGTYVLSIPKVGRMTDVSIKGMRRVIRPKL